MCSFILWPNSLDCCLAVNNTTSLSHKKVACRVGGRTVTPAARGTYGVHMKRTMREWSNAVRGALLLKPKKPFGRLFSPAGQNISCMLIFFLFSYRAVVASQSSECAGSRSKPEMSILPPADVSLVVYKCALICKFIQSDSSVVNDCSNHHQRALRQQK